MAKTRKVKMTNNDLQNATQKIKMEQHELHWSVLCQLLLFTLFPNRYANFLPTDITYQRSSNKSNTSATGTSYRPGGHEFISRFYLGSNCLNCILLFCIVFCGSLLVYPFFSCWSLHRVSSYDWQILIVISAPSSKLFLFLYLCIQ